MTRSAAFALLQVAAVLAFGACTETADVESPTRLPRVAEAADDESGRTLYLSDCAWCHGNRGQGTGNAPDLIGGTNGPALTDFVLSTGRMPLPDPTVEMRRGPVEYSESEIAAIVDYVATFQPEGPEIPELELEDANLAVGGELYLENCAACHSTTGIGGAMTSGAIAPSLHPSTALEIAEAIRTGPGTMPVFGPDTLSDSEVDSIVLYTLSLQDPTNHGGADLGGIGPVAEGAIAIFVALLAVLGVTRWIGTRADE